MPPVRIISIEADTVLPLACSGFSPEEAPMRLIVLLAEDGVYFCGVELPNAACRFDLLLHVLDWLCIEVFEL